MTVAYNIVMFAHNEEKNIAVSVESVFKVADEKLNAFYVLANGCTDNTSQEVERLQDVYGQKLKLVSLSLGDKCNAWNHYVHQLAENVPVHFFVDADVTFVDETFSKLSQKLESNKLANAAAGLPFSGRNKHHYLELVKQGKCLFGNCYALKMSFIELIRVKDFHLPIGLGWIDSAITKVVNRDLEDIQNPKEGKIIFDEDCGYCFDSLSIFSKADRSLYISRIVRYKLGKYQEKYLESLSFTDWPKTLLRINELVLKDLIETRSRFDIFNRYLVIKRIKKQNIKLKQVVDS